MEPDDNKLGQWLLERGIITQEQWDEAVHQQSTKWPNRTVGEMLKRLGYLSESQLTEGIAHQRGIAFVRLSELETPPHVTALILRELAVLYLVIPVEERNGVLVLAGTYWLNANARGCLRRLLNRPVASVLTTIFEIMDALKKYYGHEEKTVPPYQPPPQYRSY